jgi:hypothetical protein
MRKAAALIPTAPPPTIPLRGRCSLAARSLLRSEPVIAGEVSSVSLPPSKRLQSLSKGGDRPKRKDPPTAAAYRIASTFNLRSAPSIRNSALRAAMPMSLVLVFPVVAVSPPLPQARFNQEKGKFNALACHDPSISSARSLSLKMALPDSSSTSNRHSESPVSPVTISFARSAHIPSAVFRAA